MRISDWSSDVCSSDLIYELARIIDRIAAYDFPAQQNKFTRAFFAASARQTPGQLGDAMRRFSENPRDQQAIDLLSANYEYVGQVREEERRVGNEWVSTGRSRGAPIH